MERAWASESVLLKSFQEVVKRGAYGDMPRVTEARLSFSAWHTTASQPLSRR